MSAEEAASPPPPRAHWIVWLFAIVGLLGLLAFILVVALALAPSGRYQPAKVAGKKPEETFTVGSAYPLKGTDLIRMDIAASDGRGGSYGGSRADIRNILLLDRRTGTSRRLLPDNSRRIAHSGFFPALADGGDSDPDLDLLPGEPAADGAKSRPAAYYLLRLEQARNRDLQDIVAGRLADGRQAVVMTGIDGIDSAWMDSPTRLGLIVRDKLRLHYRIVDMASLRVVENRPIAID
ncbi:MAG TPA: hypothetical protein VFQ67_04070 [Allosphingosinicella sp.]|jgi:hypothetical protein|nr:hypothetical protein [Allosphingosinicella sp.]